MIKPKASSPALDPLLASIIAKLPAASTAWPAERRQAWLKMIAMAFDVVYGPEGDIAIGAGEEPTAANFAPDPRAATETRCFIDRDGYARGPTGERIRPNQVTGRLYDQRGEDGDLGAIIWADGSTGVLGMQLDISPV